METGCRRCGAGSCALAYSRSWGQQPGERSGSWPQAVTSSDTWTREILEAKMNRLLWAAPILVLFLDAVPDLSVIGTYRDVSAKQHVRYGESTAWVKIARWNVTTQREPELTRIIGSRSPRRRVRRGLLSVP